MTIDKEIERDWPIWKWAAATAALLLAPAGLWGLSTWIAPDGGLWERMLIGNGLVAAALAVWWLRRDTDADAAATPDTRERPRTEGDPEEAERRSRIGMLLGLALAGAAAVFMDAGFRPLVEAFDTLPSVSWGTAVLILVHASLIAGAMAVALTDTWPIYTAGALALLLLPSTIADAALALVVAAALVPIVALLLTLRSWQAAFWFCVVAGLEWLLWTTVAHGAALYDPIDGVVGAAWALAAALLAWTYGPKPRPS